MMRFDFENSFKNGNEISRLSLIRQCVVDVKYGS